MFIAVHADAALFGKAGANAVGACMALVPHGAGPQVPPAAAALQRARHVMCQHHARGIGQQGGVAHGFKRMVQPRHFRPRKIQHAACVLAGMAQFRAGQHIGQGGRAGVERVIMLAAPP